MMALMIVVPINVFMMGQMGSLKLKLVSQLARKWGEVPHVSD